MYAARLSQRHLYSAGRKKWKTDLHHAQVLQAILNLLLDLPCLRFVLVLPESVPRPPTGVLAEVEARELGRLAKQGSEL